MRDPALDALIQLRRTRQRNRLGNLEWFETAYRVYIVALFGGGTVLWISASIGDEPVSAATAAEIARNAPAVLGLLAILALMIGMRSGAQGGPLALEAADVSYVMLSPVDRSRALLRPAVQRMRSAGFAGVVAGLIIGQLAGRRLPGSLLAWACGGALFGVTVALLWVGPALVAHAVRLPLWLATTIGLTALAWQAAAVVWHVPAPGTLAGGLALWGWRQHPVELLATAAGVALVVAGLAMLARTSLDALARRSSLVAQLRFAVTMQDIRTVVLLRRQLNQERTRQRPWVQLRRGNRGHAIWRRGWHSLFRMPASRLVRMAAIAAAAGVMEGLVVRGTSPAVFGAAVLLFLLGLEVMEPLSQEIDQPDRTDALPIERGELLVRHLIAPSVALVPFAVIAATAGVLTYGTTSAIPVAAIMALPIVLSGAAGGVVSIVRDASDPMRLEGQTTMMMPEMAGLSMVLRVLVPLVVSALGVSSIIFVRLAGRAGENTTAAALRGALVSLLVAFAVGAWVRLGDRMKKKFRAFMAEGRSHTSQQRRVS